MNVNEAGWVSQIVVVLLLRCCDFGRVHVEVQIGLFAMTWAWGCVPRSAVDAQMLSIDWPTAYSNHVNHKNNSIGLEFIP